MTESVPADSSLAVKRSNDLENLKTEMANYLIHRNRSKNRYFPNHRCVHGLVERGFAHKLLRPDFIKQKSNLQIFISQGKLEDAINLLKSQCLGNSIV